jgi:serine/threonine protein kinase
MAPECTSGRKFLLSIKSDVYSYGVLVLEIITGHKIYTFEGQDSEGLVEYVSSAEILLAAYLSLPSLVLKLIIRLLVTVVIYARAGVVALDGEERERRGGRRLGRGRSGARGTASAAVRARRAPLRAVGPVEAANHGAGHRHA